MKRKIFSILFAVVLLASFSLVTAVPVAAQDGVEPDAIVFPFELGGKTTEADYTAEWDEVTVHGGSSSVHLATAGEVGSGNEARILIDLSNLPEGEELTLGELESISWWVYAVTGYPPHLDITLDTTDANQSMLTAEMNLNCVGAPKPIATLQGEIAYDTGWLQTFELTSADGFGAINDDTIFWVTKMGSGDQNAPWGTLADWKDSVVANDPETELAKTEISSATVVTAFEIEVDNWVLQSEAYVDDITVNGILICGQIQDAIDSVGDNSFIYVMPGTYNENVVINESLDLVGAGRETTTIDGNNVRNTITITASDVLASGFTVTGGYANSGDVFAPYGGIVVDGNGGSSALTGITIVDNIINGNAGNGVFVSAAGDGGTAGNIAIRNNQISNNGNGGNFAGISLTYLWYEGPEGSWEEWRRPKNILVQENKIYTNAAYGIYVNAGKDNVIRLNEMWDNSKYGLQLVASMPLTEIPCEYTTVEKNEIYDNAKNGVKLTSYNQHNTFTGNTINNNGAGGINEKSYGFLFQDGNDNTIANNKIYNNAGGGLYLWGKGDPSYTWYSTENNNITGNTIYDHSAGCGIYIPAKAANPNSGFLNSHIEQNTFNNNSIQVLDKAEALVIEDILAPHNTFDRAVVVEHSSLLLPTIWSSIQDGIDNASSGDTVNVAAGTYQERLASWKDMEITKSLSLIGAGSGSTIVELSEGDGNQELDSKMNGLEISGSNLDVLLQGITFTRTPGNTYATNFAIRVAETTSTFSKLTFKDVEVAYAGARDVLLGKNGAFDEVYIEDCYFHHAGAWGFSSAGTVSKITVKNSDFEYNGQVDTEHGNGFDLTGTSTNVLVEGGSFSYNTQAGINLMQVSDAIFRGVVANNNAGSPGGGFGIKLDEWGGKSQNILFENCTAMGNGLDGITIQPEKDDAIEHVRIVGATLSDNGRNGLNLCYIYSGVNNPEMHDVSISFSNITRNGSYGVQVWSWWEPMTITEVFDATMNWWGDNTGPEQVATNPDGKGNAVSDNVDYMPWLTKASEEVLAEGIGYYGFALVYLETGWNILSTPFALDEACNTWDEFVSFNGLQLIGDAYYFNGKAKAWGSVDTSYLLKPCDAIYVRMAQPDIAALLTSPERSVPTKTLYKGWNLVGLSWMPLTEKEYGLRADLALKSVELVGSLIGYTQVVSPWMNQHPWTYIPGMDIENWGVPEGYMEFAKGYWVFMENGPDDLAGSWFTPMGLP